MHVPVSIVEEALVAAKEIGADFTVAIGGGSTTGLAKALSLRAGLPSLVIPTTYAGSEVTPIWGMTEDGIKTTGRDAGEVPRTVIYDPDLTRSLPLGMSSEEHKPERQSLMRTSYAGFCLKKKKNNIK